jgi:mycofactocin system transcriptional regulator
VLTGTASTSGAAEVAGGRRGRPPGTSRRELELIALRLFTEQGFDNTTIEQIAAEAGVSKRTFFRYFGSKTSVLWSEFDHEVDVIRAALAGVPAGVPMMDAIRRAVVAANHYGPHDVPELRMRMNLVGTVPALQSSAALHYDAWERAISDFAAIRTGQPADSLYPLAVGRATLAACRAAYDRWSARADADLTFYLDAALAALAAGFDPDVIRARAQALSQDTPAASAPNAGPCPGRSGLVQTEAERVPRRVQEHPERCARLMLVLSRTEIEHRRLGGVEIVDDDVEVHLLGHFLSRPSGRGVGLHLQEGNALTVLRADVSVVWGDLDLPVQHGAVEGRERGRVGTVDNDAREACDSHAGHGIRDCRQCMSGLCL